MSGFTSDEARRVSGNNAGKSFYPKYPYGPRPQPSSQFSYDHNQCRPWFDSWLRRGGTIARDCVYVQSAQDHKDLRDFEAKINYFRIVAKLNSRRATLRQRGLLIEIRAARQQTNIVAFKPKKP
jgi:hypothetical protein